MYGEQHQPALAIYSLKLVVIHTNRSLSRSAAEGGYHTSRFVGRYRNGVEHVNRITKKNSDECGFPRLPPRFRFLLHSVERFPGPAFDGSNGDNVSITKNMSLKARRQQNRCRAATSGGYENVSVLAGVDAAVRHNRNHGSASRQFRLQVVGGRRTGAVACIRVR